jgi:hypothetical protein
MPVIAEGLKDYLSAVETTVIAPKSVQDYEGSVYSAAVSKGMTLREFVSTDPYSALLVAERCVTEWTDFMTEAILSNRVTTKYGTARLNKSMADLFKLRLDQARHELIEVRKIVDSITYTGSRTDKLINTLYNRAVENGDTRALLYIVDKIDGKIGTSVTTEKDYAANIYLILHSLFDRQLEVINSGPGTKICCCSRRSGKSHLAVAMALISSLSTPQSNVLYIGETQRMAERIFGKAADQMVETLHLKDMTGKRLNWKKLDNGSEIIIRGLSNTKDPDSIRGLRAQVIIIDEFFHLKSELLQYLQAEVLEPMQLDYANSYKQLLIGTPPKFRQTYGEHVWKTFEFPKYQWTWEDNPYIKDGLRYLERVCKEKGIAMNSPYVLREYYGQWVFETDFLLFPDYYTYLPEEQIPNYNINIIDIGIDYGTSDYTAIVGIAWDSEMCRGFVFYEKKFNVLTCPNGMGMLQYLKNVVKDCWRISLDFFPSLSKKDANRRIRWSADSTDQMLTQELNRGVKLESYPELSLQIIDAHRSEKSIMEDKMRDIFRTGALLLPKGGECAMECELTTLKRDDAGNPTREIDHKHFHPDILSALRYALWHIIGRMNINTESLELPDGVIYGGSFDPVFDITATPIYEKEAV